MPRYGLTVTDVGSVAIERFAGVLLGGRPDVAALGIEDQQHPGIGVGM